jgi:hypothetical protein
MAHQYVGVEQIDDGLWTIFFNGFRWRRLTNVITSSPANPSVTYVPGC